MTSGGALTRPALITPALRSWRYSSRHQDARDGSIKGGLIISLITDNYYLLNLFFSLCLTSILLIYLGRFTPEDPRTSAFQRMLLGVLGWAFYDFAISHAARTYSPELAFDLYRWLSCLFLFYPPAAGELILSLTGRMNQRRRFWLYAPYGLLYLTSLIFPDLTSGRMFGIPGGWPDGFGPWNWFFKLYTVSFIGTLLTILILNARHETDTPARREKRLLFIGGACTLAGIALAQVLRNAIPGLPWMAHLATTTTSLAAFWGLRQYGRVLSPRALYKATVQATPSGLLHLREGSITWANQGMAGVLGLEAPEDLFGRDVSCIMPDSTYTPEQLRDLADRLSTGRIQDMEIALAGGRGRIVHCLVSGSCFDGRDPSQGALAVFTDITERIEAERALRESQRTLSTLMSNMPGMAYRCRNDPSWTMEFVSDGIFDLTGYRPEELISNRRLSYTELIHPEDRQRVRDEVEAGLEQSGVFKLNYRIVTLEGRAKWVWEQGRAVGVPGAGEAYLEGFVTDITERRLAEERIMAALNEKEVLLREIHHRVKNNMQVISSLLNLQAGNETDGKVIEALRESRDRVAAMALVHEALYGSGSLAEVDLGRYIESLVAALVQSYQPDHLGLTLDQEVEADLAVGLDQAVPCGLVLNELISNTFKHAFPRGGPGRILVKAGSRGKDGFSIEVRDDGVGLPLDANLKRNSRLGLTLVTALVEKQLGGRIEIDRTGGTCFRVICDGASADLAEPAPESIRRTA